MAGVILAKPKGGSTLSGSISTNQVAYGTGVNTIGGNANFTYDSGTGALTVDQINSGNVYLNDASFLGWDNGGANETLFSVDAQMALSLSGGGNSAVLDFTGVNTTAKTFTFPNTTGTIALTSDLSAYLLLDQTTPQTVINGAPTFGGGINVNGTADFGLQAVNNIGYLHSSDGTNTVYLVDSTYAINATGDSLFTGDNSITNSLTVAANAGMALANTLGTVGLYAGSALGAPIAWGDTTGNVRGFLTYGNDGVDFGVIKGYTNTELALGANDLNNQLRMKLNGQVIVDKSSYGDDSTPALVVNGYGDGGYATYGEIEWQEAGTRVGLLSSAGGTGQFYLFGDKSSSGPVIAEFDAIDRSAGSDKRVFGMSVAYGPDVSLGDSYGVTFGSATDETTGPDVVLAAFYKNNIRMYQKTGIGQDATTNMFEVAAPPATNNYMESPNATYALLAHNPVTAGSVSGNYIDAGTMDSQNYNDDGTGFLLSNYDSHIVGTIDYVNGIIDVAGYFSETIETVNYTSTGITAHFNGRVKVDGSAGGTNYSASIITTTGSGVGLGLYNTGTDSSARNWGIVSNYQSYGDFAINQGLKQNSDPLADGTSATKFYIDSSGNTGFGTVSPSSKLHVISTTEQLRLGYNSSNYFSTTVGSTGGVTFNAIGSGSAFSFSDKVAVTTGRITGNMDTMTYAGTISLNVELGNLHKTTTVNATGNATINASGVGTAGQHIWVLIINDATSGKVITFGTNFKPNGTLTGTVSKAAMVEFVSDGINWYEVARTLAL